MTYTAFSVGVLDRHFALASVFASFPLTSLHAYFWDSGFFFFLGSGESCFWDGREERLWRCRGNFGWEILTLR